MKIITVITMSMLLCLTGCFVQQPTQPQGNTTIIRQPAQNKTIIVAPPQQPRPGLHIDIKVPNSSCTRERHCGNCDVCRRHGWVRIEINK